MRQLSDLDIFDVIIMAGQSNEGGRAPKVNAQQPYLLDSRGSYIWQGSSIEPYSVKPDGIAGTGQYPFISPNNEVTQHGPDAGIVRAWENRYDKPVIVFKYAIGGTAMLAGAGALTSSGVWEPNQNQIFNSFRREWLVFVDHVKTTYEKGIRVAFAHWCQGEADWQYLAPDHLGEYKQAIFEWGQAVRGLAANPSLPIILQMPVRYDYTSNVGDANWVRYEQIEYAIENANVGVARCSLSPFFGATNAAFTTDLTHLDSRPQIIEGIRAVEMYAAMQDTAIVAPTAPTNVTILAITDTTATVTWTGSGSREYIITQNDIVVGTTTLTTFDLAGLTAGTQYTIKVHAQNDAFDVAFDSAIFTTTGAVDIQYSQWEWLETQTQFTLSERKEILAKRYATNVTSTSADYIPNYFEIPASVTWADGETWVDDQLGYKHTIVANNRKIKNCERWIINDAGIFFIGFGSGSATRNIEFFLRGQDYPVLGQTGSNPNRMTITVNGTSSTDADNKMNNAWFVSDTVFAWVDGLNTIATRDILTGVTGSHTVNFPGSEFINLGQSDGTDCRRAYNNPIMDPIKTSYNAANPTASIDDDKVYRIFHVSADKKQYIILVYTISTGAWTYLDSVGATTSESATPVVHSIVGTGKLNPATTIDFLSLNPSGKRVISNTTNPNGEGFNYHYVDGTKVLQVYANSNHKSMGPIYDDKDYFTEKLTGSTPDNAALGGVAGDMFFLRVDPNAETRDGVNSVALPPGDTALYAGGDQGSHNGCILAAYAGHRDNDPVPLEIWRKQVIMMDPVRSGLASPDFSKYGRFRVAQLNVTTGGGDGDDPGAIPDTCYEVPGQPGRYQTGVYFHDTDINHNGTLREGIIYTEIQLQPDNDSLVTLKQALVDSDLESNQ